jgi:hypothetical protein
VNGFALLAVVLAIGVAAAVASKAIARRRREGIAAFAARFGLEYSREDPYGLTERPFRLFAKGDGRGCENVVSGAWQGLPLRVADFWYYDERTDSEGHRSKQYHRFSVAVADVACITPYVSVSRETVLSTLARHVGLHDIEFESEAFNRAFDVTAYDRRFAFELIDARMERFLLASGGGFGFEFQGPALLVYCHRRCPMDLVPLFGTAKGFVDHVPRLVWTEYGTTSGPPPPPVAGPERGGGSQC